MAADRGVTVRAIAVGTLFSFLAAFMAHYCCNIVHGSSMAIDHMPVAAISLFFLLLGVLHVLIKVVRRPLGLASGELLVVYIMSFVACSVTTMGFGSQILPILAAPQYYTTPQNQWAETVLPHARRWLVPQDKEAIRAFFEGLAPGVPVPWGAWALPLLCWLPFILSLYVMMICIPVIMRRQWMERERLVFPLAQLPMEMVRRDKDTGAYPFFSNRLMWLGFVIPVVVCSFVGLHRYFPAVPAVDLAWSVPTFRQTQSLRFRISFPIIGFLYLVNLDIAFSLWFFALFSHVIAGSFKIMGVASTENLGIYGTQEAIFNHLGTGAIVAFVLYGLWMARFHLRDVFLKAFTRGSSVDDSGELLSYRTAVLSCLVCFAFMSVWLTLSGLPPLMAVSFLVLALIIYYGLTRIVIQAGVPTLVAPGIASSQLISAFGTGALGESGLVSLAWTYAYAADLRTFVMSAASNSIRIAEGIGKHRKRLFFCLLLAIVVSIVTSLVVDLHLAYRYGGLNLRRWFFVGGPKAPFQFITMKILHPTGPSLSGWLYKLAGGGIMAVLMVLKEHLLWWPLHPIGWTIGPCWLMQQLWLSIFIVWLLKGAFLKLGGPKLYRSGKPFFFGMVLGQYVVAAMWFIIDLLCGMQGNSVFWI